MARDVPLTPARKMNEMMRQMLVSEVELMAILNICEDPVLLETRSAVLQKAGYSMVSASSVAVALEILRTQRFDLVVVGQSLPVGERDLLTCAVRGAGNTAVLLVSQGYEMGIASPDLVVSPLAGPRGLLNAVRKILLEEERAAT